MAVFFCSYLAVLIKLKLSHTLTFSHTSKIPSPPVDRPVRTLWSVLNVNAVQKFCPLACQAVSLHVDYLAVRLKAALHFQNWCFLAVNTNLLFFSKSHCCIAVFMQCITVGPYLKLTMASSQCCHSNKMSWSSHLRAGEGWGWPFLVGLPAAKELDATLSAVCDWLWWTSLLKHNSLPTITTPFQIQPQSR